MGINFNRADLFRGINDFLGGLERLHAIDGRRGVRRQHKTERCGGQVEQEIELGHETLHDIHVFTFRHVQYDNNVGILQSCD